MTKRKGPFKLTISKIGKWVPVPYLLLPVGRNNNFNTGRNLSLNVQDIQSCLNILLDGDYLRPFKKRVEEDGFVSGYTLQLIERFQAKVGIIGKERNELLIYQNGETLVKLVEVALEVKWAKTNIVTGGEFCRKIFFDLYAVKLNDKLKGKITLNGTRRQGLDRLLGCMEKDPLLVDVRWMAYMLATISIEHPDFQPGIENGEKSYFKRYEGINGNRNFDDAYKYRGRGYVQLTGLDLYKNHEFLVPGLLQNPDLAMISDNAYKIMSHGMRNGTYTGVGLSQYIYDDVCNYKSARQVVNGFDRADDIADLAREFEDILKKSHVTNY